MFTYQFYGEISLVLYKILKISLATFYQTRLILPHLGLRSTKSTFAQHGQKDGQRMGLTLTGCEVAKDALKDVLFPFPTVDVLK